MGNILVKVLSEMLEDDKIAARQMRDGIKEPMNSGDLLYLIDVLKGHINWTWEWDKDGSITVYDKNGEIISEINHSLTEDFLQHAKVKFRRKWKLASDIKSS